MERQDIDDELSTTGTQELLSSTSAAHLAYIGKDGTPRVLPVGFFWTGDQFVISTATTAPKVTALAARPDVALSIEGRQYARPGASTLDTWAGKCRDRRRRGTRVPRRGQEEHGRRGGGGVRTERPRDVRPDGPHRDHAALGALLRLRRRPAAAISAGAGRAARVLSSRHSSPERRPDPATRLSCLGGRFSALRPIWLHGCRTLGLRVRWLGPSHEIESNLADGGLR